MNANLIRPCLQRMVVALALATSGAQAAGAGTVADSPVLARIASSGQLTMAHGDVSFPFSYLDSEGMAQGYSVEICRLLAAAVGAELRQPLKVNYVVAKGARRMQAIVDGQADIECGSTTNNAERRKHVAFAPSHYVAGARLMVDRVLPVTRVDDMEGRTIVTIKDTTGSRALRTRIADLKLRITQVDVESPDEAFSMLENRRVDGMFNDDVLLHGLRARSADPQRWKVVDRTYTVEPMAIMFRKDDPVFKRLVDRVVRQLIASGAMHRLYETWFMHGVPGQPRALDLPMNRLTSDYFKRPADLSF